MALFEIDNGKLVPAQFGYDQGGGLSAGVLDVLRAQILEVVARPLFPISWHDSQPTDAEPDGGPRQLIALDASGQVVTVEIMQELNSGTLVEALARLGAVSSQGWVELARQYPGGVEQFRAGWTEFREAMPASVAPGPRLLIVTGRVDEAVHAALETLSKTGLEVYQVKIREMSNGRRFLQSEAVDFARDASVQVALRVSQGLTQRQQHQQLLAATRSRPVSVSGYGPGHVDLGAAQSGPVPQTAVPDASDKDTATVENAAEVHTDEGDTGTTSPGEPGQPVQPDNTPDTVEIESADVAVGDCEKAQPEQAESAKQRQQPATVVDPNGAVKSLGYDAHGLVAIAEVCGADVVLFHGKARATLRSDGVIECGDGTVTQDPQIACESLEIISQSPWNEWVIDDPQGPTLAEAIAELNEAINAGSANE